MYNGKKYQTARTTEEQKHYYWQMLVDDVDACLLRLFECFLESAPQLMWQLYIWVTLKPHEDDVTGNSIQTDLDMYSCCGSQFS